MLHVGPSKPEEIIMGLATYAIIENGKTETGDGKRASRWGVLHDGNVEGDYETKESAFESAVSAASVAIRQGHEVHVSVPSSQTGNGAALGGPTN